MAVISGAGAILTAIVTLTGEPERLLIVENTPGDHLNLSLAAEKAPTPGFRVAMVLVKDDIFLPDNPPPWVWQALFWLTRLFLCFQGWRLRSEKKSISREIELKKKKMMI